MRYALIIAGGSGTRLWPMSRGQTPKQLIPFIQGRSLLQIAFDRLEGLIPAERRCICAGQKHEALMLQSLPALSSQQFLGEPMGRDTLNAVGFASAVIAHRDPEAVIAVFTADHIIEPVDQFQAIVQQGYELAEQQGNALVTFGIAPTAPATGYGYLKLGGPVGAGRIVEQFREKPDLETARQYLAAGPEAYLWNSGMFVWRASTLLDCIRRYEPVVFQGLMRIAAAWDSPLRQSVLEEVYPTLKKISVDYAVMEPASRDPQVRVAAVPMPLKWLDVGSWPSFALTCPHDAEGNALGGGRPVLLKTRNTLVASSDPAHVIATIGCDGLLIVHTADATLVCRADDAEGIKELHAQVGRQLGPDLL